MPFLVMVISSQLLDGMDFRGYPDPIRGTFASISVYCKVLISSPIKSALS
jgi:hypothetical protein